MNRNIISPDKAVKGLFGTFAAALVLALPIRVYQLLFLIEPATGFYSKTNFTVPFLYVLLAAAGVLFFLLSYYPKQVSFGGKIKSSKIFAVLPFAIAVAFIIDAAIKTSDIFAMVTSTDVTGYAASQNMPSLFSGDSFMIFIRIIFAVISCVYFAILGFSYCGIIYDASQFKSLALAPLAWTIFRLITDFMWKINYRNISDLLLEMFMLAAFMFFFLSFARINSDIGREGAYRKLYAFGFTGSLIALTLSVPRLVLILIGQSNHIVNDFGFSPVDLLIGIFMVYYLLISVKSKEEPESEQAEKAE